VWPHSSPGRARDERKHTGIRAIDDRRVNRDRGGHRQRHDRNHGGSVNADASRALPQTVLAAATLVSFVAGAGAAFRGRPGDITVITRPTLRMPVGFGGATKKPEPKKPVREAGREAGAGAREEGARARRASRAPTTAELTFHGPRSSTSSRSSPSRSPIRAARGWAAAEAQLRVQRGSTRSPTSCAGADRGGPARAIGGDLPPGRRHAARWERLRKALRTRCTATSSATAALHQARQVDGDEPRGRRSATSRCARFLRAPALQEESSQVRAAGGARTKSRGVNYPRRRGCSIGMRPRVSSKGES